MEPEIAWLLLFLQFYLLPTLFALMRQHQSVGGIFVVNLFPGWTVLGWIIALAWSLSGVRRDA